MNKWGENEKKITIIVGMIVSLVVISLTIIFHRKGA